MRDVAAANISAKGLAIGREDSQLCAVSYYDNTVYRYDPVTGLQAGVVLGGITHPRGVIYGPDGSIYVASELGNVVRYDINDSRLTDFLSGITNPQYLALVPAPAEPPTPECGDALHPYPVGDFNEDCIVGLEDLSMLLVNWLGCTHPDCD